MEQQKTFQQMTPEEQLKHVTDLSSFKEEKLPQLCILGDAWQQADFKNYEVGLNLLNAFPVARDFVRESYQFGDYSRRMTLIKHYISVVEEEIGAGRFITSPSGQKIVHAPAVQPTAARRGRPAKTEAAAAVNPTPQATTSTAPADLFATAVNAQLGAPTHLHLDQLAWLLPQTIADKIPNIASIRGAAAQACEQAKLLADAGVAKELVEPHANEAVRLKEEEAAIYRAIDTHLAALYVHLQVDENYGGLNELAESKGQTLQTIMDILKPYHDKMNSEGAMDEMKAKLEAERKAAAEKANVDPAEVAAAAERKKASKRIQTYMRRSDMALTQKRIDTMVKYIAEAVDMGENVEEYEVILNKAKADFEEKNKSTNKEEK